MTVLYMPTRKRSRVARLEALLQNGMSHDDALKAVDMTPYELVQELKAMAPVSQMDMPHNTSKLSAKIIPFARRQCDRAFSKRPKSKPAPKSDSPYTALHDALSFPDATDRSLDKRF